MNLAFYRWLLCQIWNIIREQMGYWADEECDVQMPDLWYWAQHNAAQSHRDRAWISNRWAAENWEAFLRWREYDKTSGDDIPF